MVGLPRPWTAADDPSLPERDERRKDGGRLPLRGHTAYANPRARQWSPKSPQRLAVQTGAGMIRELVSQLPLRETHTKHITKLAMFLHLLWAGASSILKLIRLFRPVSSEAYDGFLRFDLFHRHARGWNSDVVSAPAPTPCGSRVCRVMQVQHPLDRGGDVVLSPFWQLAEPVACFLSSSKASGARAVSAIQTNAPVWFEIRLHPVLAGTSPATSAIRHGRAGPGP